MDDRTGVAPRRSSWRRRVQRLREQWRTVVVLTVMWLLLWGDLSWGNVVAGAALAVVVVTVLPLPSIGTHATLRPWPLLVLVARFVADLVVASFQVAWQAVWPGPQPRGGVVAVPLRTTSDVFFTTIAELSALVPGSLVIEADRDRATLYLHVLDLAVSGGADAVRERTRKLEERVLRAFAEKDELRRTGLLDGGEAASAGAAAAGEETR
ncbi:Na+/H+ antiporter subunit E [Xylanimonas oleitrophica]|uniref:Na+/H+ antiporter subunit E n=1 Tax=Xylanimonas oleitrophica TaxID=2607479 RepID=A0A2W5WYR1_9MICO|nr:Na+/H+ antiporter subunit E [Xylanimonas oleitrophica]PZR53466.1 Na+/H+ antiporter subunit E [Xylanimonas oleitrophica]